MKIEVNINKKAIIVIVGLFVLVVGIIGVNAIWEPSTNPSHESEEVKVTIDETDYSLQEAIDQGLIGGGDVTVDHTDCLVQSVAPNNHGWTFDCGAQDRVLTKVYSKTDDWGASDHHELTFTCCKLESGN